MRVLEERTRKQLDDLTGAGETGKELTFAATKTAVEAILSAELAGSSTAHCLTGAWQHLLAVYPEKEEAHRDLFLAAVVRSLPRTAGAGGHPTPHGADDARYVLGTEGSARKTGSWGWAGAVAHAEGRIYRGARSDITGIRLAGVGRMDPRGISGAC